MLTSMFYDLQIQVFQLKDDPQYHFLVVQDFSEFGDEEFLATGTADTLEEALSAALTAVQNHLGQ